MFQWLIIICFVLGYAAIAFEHSIKLNKAAAAILTGVVCWVLYTFSQTDPNSVQARLMEQLGGISSILFFLLSAMTIVALIDLHDGFAVITRLIKTRSTVKLLWIICTITFFLSSVLDNLTTTIVMVSLCGRLLPERETRLFFTGFIVIAANAGGAFSPIGDVTTTMLWIGGQISAARIIEDTFFASLAVIVVPLLVATPKMKGKTFQPMKEEVSHIERSESTIVLIAGVAALIAVPFFKYITHLPPLMGILFSLGCLWVLVTYLHRRKAVDDKHKYSVNAALQKIDTPSILFFLGILLAVGALEASGLLHNLAVFMQEKIGSIKIIGTLLGILSAIIDNVPLVAATQGMYSLEQYPMDHPFWEFIALTTGTGGSMIIIGSAAGVAAMGIEKIDFFWYLKRISLLAALGYVAGIIVFWIEQGLFF